MSFSKPIKDVNNINFQGWLSGNTNNVNTELPTIAIVSHYDTLSLLPTYGSGISSSGSGTIAVLEILRFMSHLYNYDENIKPKYNLLFLLFDGSSLNYLGAEIWLNKASAALLDSIEFSICLDSIGKTNELFLYVSRLPKTEELKNIYNTFETIAKNYNIKFEIVHKKIIIGKEELRFEHERFSYSRIAAGTLTNAKLNEDNEDSNNNNNNDRITSIFDKKIDYKNYLNNLNYVTDSILHILYPLNEDISILGNEFNISEINVKQISRFYNTSENSILLINDKNLLVKGIAKEFEENCNEYIMDKSELKSKYKFYTISRNELSFITVKGPLMELVLFFISAGYLFCIKVAIDFIYNKTNE